MKWMGWNSLIIYLILEPFINLFNFEIYELSEVYKTNIKRTKNEIKNIFNKVSSIKSHNDRIIFIKEKLYSKFKDKNIVVIFFAKFSVRQ